MLPVHVGIYVSIKPSLDPHINRRIDSYLQLSGEREHHPLYLFSNLQLLKDISVLVSGTGQQTSFSLVITPPYDTSSALLARL